MEPTELNEKPKFNWKRLLITVGIVIITAGAIGGSVYYVMNQQATKDKESAEKTAQDLQKQIDDLKKTTTSTSTTTTTPTTTTTDATAVWKTYSNTTLGYSYKYPSTLTFNTGKGISNNNLVRDESNYVNINAIQNTYSKTPEAYFSEVTRQSSANTTPGSAVFEGGKNNKTVTIGANKAVVFDYTLPGGQVWKVYLLTDNKTAVEVTVVGDANMIKTAESILATLVLNNK